MLIIDAIEFQSLLYWNDLMRKTASRVNRLNRPLFQSLLYWNDLMRTSNTLDLAVFIFVSILVVLE